MSSRRRVDVEAGPGRGREVEPLVERHRAVVAGADRDADAVQDLGHVVRVDAGQVERHDAAAQVRVERPVQLDVRDLARQRRSSA